LLIFSSFGLYLSSFSILSRNILANSDASCCSPPNPSLPLKFSGRARFLKSFGAIVGLIERDESYAKSLCS
jgi:hypothetical protein